MLDRIAPLPRLRLYTKPESYLLVLRDALSGRRTAGGDLESLAVEIARRVGVRHAIPMPLARVAIHVAIKALIRPGQTVILSPYTIADVVNMVVSAGGVPVFADIDRATCNIDAASVEQLIDVSTGCVLVTHFYGLMCDIARIRDVCRAKGVPLIEDAAQAFGARLDGRSAGTFGAAGVYSFGMYKNVNSFFGGMVVTDDDRLAARIRDQISSWPYQPGSAFMKKVAASLAVDIATHPVVFRLFTFWLFRTAFLHGIDGINNRLKIDLDPQLLRALPETYRIRMTPSQARLILKQLADVDALAAHRLRAAEQWYEGLRDLPDLLLPPLRTDGSHIYWYFPVQYARRHDLVAFAMRHGRDITESYHRNCATLPCFAEYSRPCPNADATANALIYLPTYPRYGEPEIAKTIRVIRAYFGR